MISEKIKQDKKIIQTQAIKDILESEKGKYLLDYLSEICIDNLGVYSNDPYVYAFNEGQRSILIMLLKTAQININELIKMRTYTYNNEEF